MLSNLLSFFSFFFFFLGGIQADADARCGNVRNRRARAGSKILGIRTVHVLVGDTRYTPYTPTTVNLID